jgi:DNA polymerase elongation subunit (family B)
MCENYLEEEDEEDELEKDEKEQQYDEREDNFDHGSIQYQNSKDDAPDRPEQVFRKYKGAVVLEPKRGLHQDAHVFDVTSLYPTIIIKYNLSPETVEIITWPERHLLLNF